MDLDRILASACRRRIIQILYKQGSMNIMSLVRKVNSTYNQVNANLQIIEKENITIEQRFGRIRMIKLNRENPKSILLLQTLEMLGL
jgi:predicted transcriptional regulator